MLWRSHRCPAFHSSRLGGDFCILRHTSLLLSLHAGLTLRLRDPDAASVASNLLWAFPMTTSPQQNLWCSWRHGLSSSVWIKQVRQKLFALNHMVRAFNNAWKHHPFSSSLVFWPAMLQVDLFSTVIELVYKDIVYSTQPDTCVSGEGKSE